MSVDAVSLSPTPAAADPLSAVFVPPRWLKLLALVLIVALYLLSIRPTWFPTPDSALYLMLGENLASGEGYTLWGRPHVHVPPGFPLLLAGMNRLGLSQVWLMNGTMIVMALLALWLCYLVLREQTAGGLAFLVAIATALSYCMHYTSVRLLSDVPYMLLLWLGIWAYLRGLHHQGAWLELGTLALVAGCLTRVAGIPIALAAAVGLVFQTRTVARWRVWANAAVLAGGILLTVAALGIYLWSVTKSHQVPNYGTHFGGLLNRPLSQWFILPVHYFYLTGKEVSSAITGQSVHPALALLLFWLPIAIGMGGSLRRRQTLCVAIAAGYLAAILIFRPLLARYLLPIAPLLALYLLEGWRSIIDRVARRETYGAYVAIACAVVIIGMNVPKTVRTAYWVHQPQASKYYDATEAVTEIGDFLRQHARSGELFVSTEAGRTLAYLSRVPSIPTGDGILRSRRLRPGHVSRWNQEGLVFAVSRRDQRSVDMLLEQACRENQFELVFQNERFQVFCCRDLKPPAHISQQQPSDVKR